MLNPVWAEGLGKYGKYEYAIKPKQPNQTKILG